ncbi:uncharacterized protein LOC132405968 isoform X1 [Hypanus sabinus]|uniref:uncharacterized protein LOC132405968 isoform X1 n=1 Tax=Hypanus sabinus TaxID=79690 RepID=UPI0028C4D036|nr:uncharacterized protein LOC132405968 isoform X1 [Hypanus sabinus]
MTEAAVPLLFWLLSLLARRRAVRVAAGTGRRNDARRRLRIRRYFQRRQRKMTLMVLARGGSICNCCTRTWCKLRDSEWWECVVLKEFQPSDWLENFRMSTETDFHICNKLKPRVSC